MGLFVFVCFVEVFEGWVLMYLFFIVFYDFVGIGGRL